MSRNIKVLFVVVAVLALAGAAYGFAAANTFTTAPANVGYVASTISGYEISNIQIDRNAGENITDFKFDLTPLTGDAPAAFVSIQTRGLTSAWNVCETLVPDETTAKIVHATCNAGGTLTFTDYTSLNILASSADNTTAGVTKINVP